MDQELIQFLETKFREAREVVREEMQEMATGLQAEIQESRRYSGVLAEGLRSEIQQVAEGHAILNEKMDRNTETLQEKMDDGFGEVKAMIRLSYAELERRLLQLEAKYGDLEARLHRLEVR